VQIDLNCDMGENCDANAISNDTAILPLVTSANIACGFHAGNSMVMARTVRLAIQQGVAVGAHPGFPDYAGFGRRALDATPAEIESDMLYQIGALAAFAHSNKSAVGHVKPHGALYNIAANNSPIAHAIARAVSLFDPEMAVVGLPGSAMEHSALELGLRFVREGYADRAYNRDGSLRSRREPDSVIDNPRRAAEQALQIVNEQMVTTPEGETIPLVIQTLCVHSDTPEAVETLRAVRKALEENGVSIVSFSDQRKRMPHPSISPPNSRNSK
jgi:5-oxoprolinase (ATP-hydrolysing) subunit A